MDPEHHQQGEPAHAVELDDSVELEKIRVLPCCLDPPFEIRPVAVHRTAAPAALHSESVDRIIRTRRAATISERVCTLNSTAGRRSARMSRIRIASPRISLLRGIVRHLRNGSLVDRLRFRLGLM